MLPNTIVDVDVNGMLADCGNSMVVLRNDISRVALTLAGAVSRYVRERVKLQLTWRSLPPFNGMLGQIVTVLQQGSQVQSVGTPVTSLEGSMPIAQNNGQLQVSTTMKAGYA